MKTRIFSQQDFRTSQWSGGTTTQLYIFPENASLHERNFLFRLSSAKVEAESSVFTSLPGISRKLMVLEGEIEIMHRGFHSTHLKCMDTDSFEGDWHTESKGKCIDFNLMFQKVQKAEMIALELEKSHQNILFSGDVALDFLFVYLFKGQAEIFSEESKIVLDAHQLVMINSLEKEKTILLNALSSVKGVLIQISL